MVLLIYVKVTENSNTIKGVISSVKDETASENPHQVDLRRLSPFF